MTPTQERHHAHNQEKGLTPAMAAIAHDIAEYGADSAVFRPLGKIPADYKGWAQTPAGERYRTVLVFGAHGTTLTRWRGPRALADYRAATGTVEGVH